MRIMSITILSFSAIFATAAWGGQDPKDVRDALSARLARLQRMQCRYALKDTSTPTAEMREAVAAFNKAAHGSRTARPWSGSINYDCEFDFLSGQARYEKRMTKDSLAAERAGKILQHEVQITVFGRERFEEMEVAWKGDKVRMGGAIANLGAEALPTSGIEAAIGLRLLEDDECLTPARIAKMKVSFPDPDHAAVESSDSKGRFHLLICDRRIGYAPTSEKVYLPAKPQAYLDVIADDFRDVAGATMPFRIRQRSFSPQKGGGSEQASAADVTVSEYTFDGKANTPELYSIVWPVGADVLDMRTGQTFSIRSKPRRLDDQAVAELLAHKDAADAAARAEAQKRIDAAQSGQDQGGQKAGSNAPATPPASR